MRDADEVYHRALDYERDLSAPGDRALRDLLTFHGSAWNGGLLDAVENYAESVEFPLARVIDAYRYFGMEAVAALVKECHDERLTVDDDDLEAGERLELRFDPRYTLDDEDLVASVHHRIGISPGDFDPTAD